MAPARITKNVEQLVAPTGSVPCISEHVRPFVERNSDGVVAVDVLGETEARCVVGRFGLERAEKPVPQNECSAVIAVKVSGVRSVMNAMVRGSVKYKLEWAQGTN